MVKSLIWHFKKYERSNIIENMCIKFEVDWISTSSKTTLTKNFNLEQDRRRDKQTEAQTRKHNAHKWGITSCWQNTNYVLLVYFMMV